MGRTIGELAAADMAMIEAVDLIGWGIDESGGQTMEAGRRELNRAIAGWSGNGD